MKRERIAFFGSPSLSHVCLESLHRDFNIALVVTQPDREKGRGRKVSMTPVKSYALEHGIAVYQSRDLGEGLVNELGMHGITLIVVVAFGRILPEQVIAFPEHESVNLHASLLPKYRGASPIEAAILGGERETGVTLQHMAPEMDRGALLDSKRVVIEDDWTAEDLHRRIAELSPSFLTRSLKEYLQGRLEPVEQDETLASYCGIIQKKDGCIEWQQAADLIRRKIRAYNVWPVAYSHMQGRQLRIYNAQIVELTPVFGVDSVPGQVILADKAQGIIVQTGSGYLGITDLQMENKRRMDHREFMNGHKNLKGMVFGAP